MCTYNGERYLPQQLDSIARQELAPDELVVCDDGSIDGTVSLLESFAAAASFPVRITCNPVNLGYSQNFLQAAELCSGDILAFADQDDVWYPRKLARLAETFVADPGAEGVFSDGDLLDENGELVGRTLWESFRFHAAYQSRFRSGGAVEELLRRNVVTGMAFAFRASCRSLLRAMPASWIHDGWLAMLLALRGSLRALPERLVGYRVHGTQQVGTPPTMHRKLRRLKEGGLAEYRTHVRDLNLDEYHRLARMFDELAGYLADASTDPLIAAKIRAKATHTHRGERALGLGRARRWPLLLPHVADYGRYSPNGLRGLVRDLLL